MAVRVLVEVRVLGTEGVLVGRVVRVRVGVRVTVRVRVAVRVAVGVAVGFAAIHLANKVISPPVPGKYGNINVLPPSLTDQPTKVSLPRVGGIGADIGSSCNTTPGAIADPPLLV